MKVSYNAKRGDFVVQVQEQDWPKVLEIAKTMQTPGWEFLEALNQESREKILDAIKMCSKETPVLDMASKLDGFDQATRLAPLLVKQMNLQMEELQHEKSDAGNAATGE